MGAADSTVRKFLAADSNDRCLSIQTSKAPMTALPAEVVAAHHVIVRIGVARYRGSFATLVFGDNKPLIGACHDRRVDLIYLQDPGLCAGQRFPLWSIQ